MRFQRINLTAAIGKLFSLREPFWVASSHLTSEDSAINAWCKIEPAALTLKSSKRVETFEATDPKHERLRDYPATRMFGNSVYCDGPKHKEFLSYERTKELLARAKEVLSETKVGVSVLAGADEQYGELVTLCKEADFFELNLKYSFRVAKPGGQASFLNDLGPSFQTMLDDVKRFLTETTEKPVFVKIPRELDWLPDTGEQKRLLDLLGECGRAGVIITNSQKADIPPFIHDGEERILKGGVVCGEWLYPRTIELIEKFRPMCEDKKIPIVASGGMITEQQILHAFRAGAVAVQLCTTFDYHRLAFYETLRSGLTARIYLQGLRSFEDFRRKVGADDIDRAPFTYLKAFWSNETQNHMQSDIRNSERMDVVVMSGHTLFKKWEDVLKQRFRSNLGMRLFLPSPRRKMYEAVQKSWGILDGPQLEVRCSRVEEAAKRYKELWQATEGTRRTTAGKEKEAESKLEVYFHDQCPFYSAYIFDDNAYVAPYPFVRAGELESPAYVFFRSGEEYERLAAEVEGLRNIAVQTQ